ncbi:hypothetical protein PRIPAC_86506 [Pristionchus pacificus]|uniref:Uncharacterized protein n=1 Tax=Pristionchus pacificus TaxID=54126 RepID=A0A2A6BS13_PRIPA|nr:hypothetical protein PRIPAC_86506 [Pristionchus pacificus]|eukprot:PDM68616.1 hypothetical protein PRIPAC_46918 [Pristionchus pacificus]
MWPSLLFVMILLAALFPSLFLVLGCLRGAYRGPGRRWDGDMRSRTSSTESSLTVEIPRMGSPKRRRLLFEAEAVRMLARSGAYSNGRWIMPHPRPLLDGPIIALAFSQDDVVQWHAYEEELLDAEVPYKIYEWKIFAATKNDNEMTHGEHDDVSQEVYQFVAEKEGDLDKTFDPERIAFVLGQLKQMLTTIGVVMPTRLYGIPVDEIM